MIDTNVNALVHWYTTAPKRRTTTRIIIHKLPNSRMVVITILYGDGRHEVWAREDNT